MFISSIGTATPPRSWTQTECWEAIRASRYVRALRPGSLAILQKVLLGSSGIDRRHFSLENLMEVFEDDPDSLMDRYTRWAPELLEKACRDSLNQLGLDPADIDGVIISTCTGYLCPGLSSYLSERLGLSPQVRFFDLVGHGCGAALPNLALGESLIRSGLCRRVLSCCVEICSAAFYLDDDPGVLISACLFGDGASAAILTAEQESDDFSVEWESYVTHLDPSKRDALRFQTSRGLLKNILSPTVPELASAGCEILLQQMESLHHTDPSTVDRWVFHAGGKKVLEALEQRLGIDSREIDHSYQVLRENGNMSSPSVMFALEHALRTGRSHPGRWFLSSFGAGLSCFGATVKVGFPGAEDGGTIAGAV